MGEVLHVIEWKVFLIREPFTGDDAWGMEEPSQRMENSPQWVREIEDINNKSFGLTTQLLWLVGRHASQKELFCLVGFGQNVGEVCDRMFDGTEPETSPEILH